MVNDMNYKFIILIAILLLVTTGCEKKEKKETFKSYDYYKAHTDEMLVRHKECEAMNYIPSDAVIEDCLHARLANGVYWAKHRK